MDWKPKKTEPKMVVVNTTTLAAYDEEKCKYCGRYGCTDRGFTLTVSDPPLTIGEAQWAQQLNDKLAVFFECENHPGMNFVSYNEPQCLRKLKKSNVQAVLEKLAACGPDCHRNLDCTEGGIWKARGEGYRCPFRSERLVCQRNDALNHGPLMCLPDKEGLVECEFHEEAYNRCFKKEEDGKPCYDLKEKFGVTDKKNNYLFMLAHRFSAAPCRYCDEATCKNEASLHFEGMCSLKGLMAPCEQYESVSPDHAYTEGVCCYVSSADGKDDRKIFNSSGYALRLSKDEHLTLCIACRISHSIAKATDLKCLGVRRSTSKPFLNETNPLNKHAIEINYLYLTHPEDVAKYNPELIAKAVYDALIMNCKGLECEEMENCNLIKRM